MRAILEAQPVAQRDELHERGRDKGGGHVGDASLGELGLRIPERGARQHAEFAEDRYACDPAVPSSGPCTSTGMPKWFASRASRGIRLGCSIVPL